MLPRYRGAAPVAWALARCEKRTGVSTMLINERMDEGDILLQKEVTIEQGERAPELERRLAAIGARLLVETLALLDEGAIEPRPQDPALATYAPMLSPRDGELDPQLGAAEIEGRVRGFEPWPGVWAVRGRRRLRLVEAHSLPNRSCSEPPGTLVELVGDGLIMACGGGSVLLVSRVQPEGGRPIGARDAVNGRHLRLGDRLERPRSR
jgi:methionyl-tRNA formyltransferase